MLKGGKHSSLISPTGMKVRKRFKRLLKRMNSAFIGYPVSRKKRVPKPALCRSRPIIFLLRLKGIPNFQQKQPHSTLLQAAGGLPHHQLRRHFAMVSSHLAFFEHRLNAFENDADCVRAHGFHGLAHSGERRSVEG
jgi:hypothetical protein